MITVGVHGSRRISPSLQEYLTAIYRASSIEGRAKITVIAKLLKVKKPSVTDAIRRLHKLGLVEYKRYGYVKLTEEGKLLAEKLVLREDTLKRLLVEILGLAEEEAFEDACRIEHDISDQAFQRLIKLVEYVLSNPSLKNELRKAIEESRDE